ncbi:hemerythrin domain-containing protein [Nocardia sp. CWNU-33]|uniref:hemerythrin domain-containing protein n=1 Tax=Nocardia sp. CWNU-33 TaxID=3392117 RepID=UPI00398E45A7
MNQPDVTMMILVHNAFRRDLLRMQAAATEVGDDPAALTALRAGWRTFSEYLTIHHTSEDEVLWPTLQAKPDAHTALLTQMAQEHAQLDPLLEQIEQDLAQASTTHLVARLERLAEVLIGHLDHEEGAALPLVRETLTPQEWTAFGNDQRRRIGIKGGAWFFPWLLDGASPQTRAFALGLLPPPLRLVYRWVWQPRYQRHSPWRPRPVELAQADRKTPVASR